MHANFTSCRVLVLYILAQPTHYSSRYDPSIPSHDLTNLQSTCPNGLCGVRLFLEWVGWIYRDDVLLVLRGWHLHFFCFFSSVLLRTNQLFGLSSPVFIFLKTAWDELFLRNAHFGTSTTPSMYTHDVFIFRWIWWIQKEMELQTCIINTTETTTEFCGV
jgi:hypothetical protein